MNKFNKGFIFQISDKASFNFTAVGEGRSLIRSVVLFCEKPTVVED